MKGDEKREALQPSVKCNELCKLKKVRKKPMTMEERIKNHVCCFCEGELEHAEGQDPDTWGNNPDNACNLEGARCCNHCKDAIVIPVRLSTAKIIEMANDAETGNKMKEALRKMEMAVIDAADTFFNGDYVFSAADAFRIKNLTIKGFLSVLAYLTECQMKPSSQSNDAVN